MVSLLAVLLGEYEAAPTEGDEGREGNETPATVDHLTTMHDVPWAKYARARTTQYMAASFLLRYARTYDIR